MFENLNNTAMDSISKGREMIAKFKKPFGDKMTAVKGVVAAANAANPTRPTRPTRPTFPSQAPSQAKKTVMDPMVKKPFGDKMTAVKGAVAAANTARHTVMPPRPTKSPEQYAAQVKEPVMKRFTK